MPLFRIWEAQFNKRKRLEREEVLVGVENCKHGEATEIAVGGTELQARRK